MAIFGSLETVRAQTKAWPEIQAALAYVEKLTRQDSPERSRLFALAADESVKVDLGGGMVAIDAAYMSRPRPDVFFETHRRNIDVQALLEGEEFMEIASRARLTPEQPYDDVKDMIKYRDYADTSVLRARSGEVMIFFPEDGHMSHAVTSPVLVRKCVVKVPVG